MDVGTLDPDKRSFQGDFGEEPNLGLDLQVLEGDVPEFSTRFQKHDSLVRDVSVSCHTCNSRKEYSWHNTLGWASRSDEKQSRSSTSKSAVGEVLRKGLGTTSTHGEESQ